MSRILLCCAVVCLLQISKLVFAEDEDLKVLTSDCNNTVYHDVLRCKENGLDKWNSSHLIHHDTNKLQCCNGWDTIDCREKVVKDHCNQTNFNELHSYYEKERESLEGKECKDYPYYGTKCTIDDNDFVNGTSQADKDKLLTPIPKPNLKCLDDNDKSLGGCVDKVAIDSGFKPEDIKNNETRVTCCVGWMGMDCLLEYRKKSENCTRYDVIGLTHFNDQKKEEWTNATGQCKDFPYGSSKCTNGSYKVAITSSLFVLLIALASFF